MPISDSVKALSRAYKMQKLSSFPSLGITPQSIKFNQQRRCHFTCARQILESRTDKNPQDHSPHLSNPATEIHSPTKMQRVRRQPLRPPQPSFTNGQKCPKSSQYLPNFFTLPSRNHSSSDRANNKGLVDAKEDKRSVKLARSDGTLQSVFRKATRAMSSMIKAGGPWRNRSRPIQKRGNRPSESVRSVSNLLVSLAVVQEGKI